MLELENAARSAIATVHHQPQFQELDIHLRADDGPLHVSMSPDRLHQVLINLLRNAADAPGVSRICLDLSRSEDETIQLRCTDDGAGFTPVALERAFEPFFTTKDVGAARDWASRIVWPSSAKQGVPSR